MNKSTKNTIIIALLSAAIIILTVVSHTDKDDSHNFYSPIGYKAAATQINENLFVDEVNEGPMNYESAVNYCKSKGMLLPTRLQAWEMWLASSNCKISMVLNRPIIKDKKTFIKSCHKQNNECLIPANEVKYTCNPDKNLLFLDEKYFRYGNYWLADRYDKNGHYTANFISGMTNAYMDSIKLLGVRCVKENK